MVAVAERTDLRALADEELFVWPGEESGTLVAAIDAWLCSPDADSRPPEGRAAAGLERVWRPTCDPMST